METTFEVDHFEEDVIAASHERPVLVDFWAPWCGPCRVLGPQLEALAAEHRDAWTLVKVNTEEHPELARRYQIRGIPAVKLFADGEVIDEFTGALPRRAIERWLDEALPSENKQRLEQAQEALNAGSEEEAERLLRAVLDDEPANGPVQVALARALVFRDPDEAAQLVEDADVAAPDLLQVRGAVQTLTRLLRLNGRVEALPDETGRTTYGAAIDALTQQDFDTALQRFIEVIRTNRAYDDDGARKACVALFTLLPKDHPAVHAHRRTFDMALY